MRGLLELRCWIQMMTWMKSHLRSQDGFELVETPPDESVFDVVSCQETELLVSCFPWVYLKILYNWDESGWIEGEVANRVLQ